MRLRLFGKHPDSGVGGCPALYETDRGTYIVQGKRVTDPEAPADLRDILDDETFVEVPREVIQLAGELMPLMTPEEFGSWELFRSFRHTAWRLETRDAYASAVEAEPFRKWLAGEPPGPEWAEVWWTTIRSATAEGRRVERVRVVPEPLTDYLRFEAWLCQYNIEAGEYIRYLDRDRARQIGIPHINHDYWLFDSNRLYVMHHDDADVLQGLELIEDPARIVEANHYRDAAWHHAIPYREWYPDHAHECEPTQRQTSA